MRERGGYPAELVNRGVRPDTVTVQTSAHDPLHGYLPSGWRWEVSEKRAIRPHGTMRAAKRSHGGACSERCWRSVKWACRQHL